MKRLIGRILLIVLIVTSCFCNRGFVLAKFQAAQEVYPFKFFEVEKYLSDIWVGDTLTLKNDYIYELQEGTNLVMLSHGEKNSSIQFNAEGIVKMKVVRKSDDAERIFEFKIGLANELKHESKIPESIKIGYRLPSIWFEYMNCHLEDRDIAVMVPAYDEFCVLPGVSYGYGGEGIASRKASARLLNWFYDEWQWLFGAPSRPGTMYYTTELEPDKQYAIKIEEPIINTNLPKEIEVGSELQITTHLDNTELVDKKVDALKQLITENKTVSGFGDLIGYQPRMEIVSGNDLIERDGGDYSNILSTSEKFTFLKEGTVEFKVVYEMIPIPVGNNGILKPEAVYSPEATFTVNIVSEPVETEEPDISDVETEEEEEPEVPDVETESEETIVPEEETESEIFSSEEETEVEMEEVELDYTMEEVTSDILLDVVVDLEEKDKVSIRVSSDITIDGNVLNELMKGEHEIVIKTVDEEGTLRYSWDIPNISNEVEEWKTGIDIGAEVEQISTLLTEIGYGGISTTISFEHSGKLPGKTNVQFYVGDKFEKTEKVFYYYHNQQKNIFEKIGEYVVDNDGYVNVEMEHCSDYVLTNELVSVDVHTNKEPALNNTVWIIVTICLVVVAIAGIMYMKKK